MLPFLTHAMPAITRASPALSHPVQALLAPPDGLLHITHQSPSMSPCIHVPMHAPMQGALMAAEPRAHSAISRHHLHHLARGTSHEPERFTIHWGICRSHCEPHSCVPAARLRIRHLPQVRGPVLGVSVHPCWGSGCGETGGWGAGGQ